MSDIVLLCNLRYTLYQYRSSSALIKVSIEFTNAITSCFAPHPKHMLNATYNFCYNNNKNNGLFFSVISLFNVKKLFILNLFGFGLRKLTSIQHLQSFSIIR